MRPIFHADNTHNVHAKIHGLKDRISGILQILGSISILCDKIDEIAATATTRSLLETLHIEIKSIEYDINSE